MKNQLLPETQKTEVICTASEMMGNGSFVIQSSIDQSKRAKKHPETISQIKWLPIEDLISKMKNQAKRFKREDADESSILKRVAIADKL